MKDDRRYTGRTPIELAASFGIPEDNIQDNAKVVNMSKGGFCFLSDQNIPVGQNLRLNVDIGDQSHVVLHVETVWVQKNEGKTNYTVGVKISDPEGPEFDKFLQFYMNQLLDTSSDD